MSDPVHSKEIQIAIARLEEILSIKKGFFNELIHEDDWSFVIKSHALIEGAVSHLLVNKTQAPELEDIFSRLELSNKDYGKIGFARALKLLEKYEVDQIRYLSELRNRVVHNVRSVNFNLVAHVKSYDANQKKRFIDVYGLAYGDSVELSGNKKIPASQFVIENPKQAIWTNLMYMLAIMGIQIDTINHEKRITEHERELAKFAILFTGTNVSFSK